MLLFNFRGQRVQNPVRFSEGCYYNMEKSVMQRKVYQCVERFHSGRTSIIDNDCSGSLTTSWMADSVEQGSALVQKDRQTDYFHWYSWQVGHLHFSLYMSLRYYKICVRWVPKQLTYHRQAHVETCLQFLQWHCEEGEAYLQQIITHMGAPLWTCKKTSNHGVKTHIIT
jgi:hypothetical protein